MGKVTIIDAPMGKGKTSWAIKYMNELGKNLFRSRIIYITPYNGILFTHKGMKVFIQ